MKPIYRKRGMLVYTHVVFYIYSGWSSMKPIYRKRVRVRVNTRYGMRTLTTTRSIYMIRVHPNTNVPVRIVG